MTIPEINTVCFVGAGTMGCLNSLVAGLAGYGALVQQVKNPTGQTNKQKVQSFINPYLQRGYLGIKTGRGFYEYPDQAYARSGFLFGLYQET